MAADYPVPRPVELELERSGDEPELTVEGVRSVEGVADGDRVRGPETLTGRVSFGGPSVVPIDHTYHPEDGDLQAYIKAKADGFRFVLATLSVSFNFGPQPLVRAGVEVTLTDNGGSGQTLAYSVFPSLLSNAKDATSGYTVKPDLTIAGTGGSLGQIDRSTVVHGTEVYMTGGPELSASPRWTFQRTPAQDIVGPARLLMVVQVPKERTGSMSVNLWASVEQRHVFAKRQVPLDDASIDDPTTVTF